jgi:peptidoglycan biosynthesis protein MviN/MurJ (putative lipid II flippase)
MQPKRQTNILNLAKSLNKIKISIKKFEVHFFSSIKRKSQNKDTIKLLIKSLNALTLPITAIIFKIEVIAVNIFFNRQRFTNKSDVRLNSALK